MSAKPLRWIALAIAAGALIVAFQRTHDRRRGASADSTTIRGTVSNASRTSEDRRPPDDRRETARAIDRSIVFENGLLSVSAREQRLGPILSEVAGKSAIAIFSAPAIDGRIVSLELHRQPLDQGLRELLQGCDVFFLFTSRDGQPALQTVWAYEKGSGSELVPVPPEAWASTADFERKLTAESPEERILAIETLVARDGPRALDAITRALADQNAEVRLRALDVALSAGVIFTPETLTALTYDAAPAVRGLALEAIVNGTAPGSPREAETRQLIRRMLGDADEDVRVRAQELLDSARPSAP